MAMVCDDITIYSVIFVIFTAVNLQVHRTVEWSKKKRGWRKQNNFFMPNLKNCEMTESRTAYSDLTRKEDLVHCDIGSSYSWAKLEEKKTLHTTKQVRHYGRNCKFLSKNYEAILPIKSVTSDSILYNYFLGNESDSFSKFFLNCNYNLFSLVV